MTAGRPSSDSANIFLRKIADDLSLVVPHGGKTFTTFTFRLNVRPFCWARNETAAESCGDAEHTKTPRFNVRDQR